MRIVELGLREPFHGDLHGRDRPSPPDPAAAAGSSLGNADWTAAAEGSGRRGGEEGDRGGRWRAQRRGGREYGLCPRSPPCSLCLRRRPPPPRPLLVQGLRPFPFPLAMRGLSASFGVRTISMRRCSAGAGGCGIGLLLSFSVLLGSESFILLGLFPLQIAPTGIQMEEVSVVDSIILAIFMLALHHWNHLVRRTLPMFCLLHWDLYCISCNDLKLVGSSFHLSFLRRLEKHRATTIRCTQIWTVNYTWNVWT